jgi:methyl-accepting chemotaxis protein
MNWFNNIPTRTKLFVIFGGLIALFAIAFGNTYRSLGELVATQSRLRDKQLNTTDFARMNVNHNETRIFVLHLLATPDADERTDWLNEVSARRADNRALLDRLVARNADDPDYSERLREYARIRQQYVSARETVLEHVRAGRMDQARAISLGQNQERFMSMSALGEQLSSLSEREAERLLQEARGTARQAQEVMLIVGVAVLALCLLGAFVLGRAVAKPMQDLLAAARRVSDGDLRTPLAATDRRDEVGVLSSAFARMLDTFRTVHAEIQEGVNVLASSASEISTATAEMAASATETATAVSQTTTTVEEVKQTAQVSAQKAGHVADVAQRAAQSAQVGRRAVDESIDGMKHIREQMELIADTIVRLSEQSQAIGEIITSVNDLAEQSNLLAVNASIEAAKAGEHGRGFAVVAHEIRSLANQSKESTAQVRAILNDIQKATTAAVMAAEQGSKAVDQGVRQANQSGEAIRSLTDTIITAAQAATQITASSQQQLIGVDQVAVAMQNILQASRQNASGTQQAEAGARSLSELGQKLKTVASRFTI